MKENENEGHVPDLADQYLAAIPSVPPTLELQERILAGTTRVLRHRRWFHRSKVAAGMAVCYAAGLLTMWLPSASSPGPAVALSPPVQSRPSPGPSHAFLPAQLEWQAIDQPHARADLFRQAGDRFLEDAQDVQSALRCYHNALARGGDEALTISADDS